MARHTTLLKFTNKYIDNIIAGGSNDLKRKTDLLWEFCTVSVTEMSAFPNAVMFFCRVKEATHPREKH